MCIPKKSVLALRVGMLSVLFFMYLIHTKYNYSKLLHSAFIYIIYICAHLVEAAEAACECRSDLAVHKAANTEENKQVMSH